MSMDKREFICKEMHKIYVMFCLPQFTIHTKTKQLSIDYVWKNDEAKKCFESLGEMLEIENIVLLKQQYAMQEIKIKELTGGDSFNQSNS